MPMDERKRARGVRKDHQMVRTFLNMAKRGRLINADLHAWAVKRLRDSNPILVGATVVIVWWQMEQTAGEDWWQGIYNEQRERIRHDWCATDPEETHADAA